MKSEKIFKGWSSLQMTLLEVTLLEAFESSMKWPVSCTELLAQKEKVTNKLKWNFALRIALIAIGAVGLLVFDSMFLFLLAIILFLYVVRQAKNLENQLDHDSLKLWADISGLFGEVCKHKSIREDINSSELIVYLEREVRKTFRQILYLQKLPATFTVVSSIKTLKAYVRSLTALVVRMEIMNVREIPVGVGMVDAEGVLYNERAGWLYKRLCKNPDFVINPESAQAD